MDTNIARVLIIAIGGMAGIIFWWVKVWREAYAPGQCEFDLDAGLLLVSLTIGGLCAGALVYAFLLGLWEILSGLAIWFKAIPLTVKNVPFVQRENEMPTIPIAPLIVLILIIVAFFAVSKLIPKSKNTTKNQKEVKPFFSLISVWVVIIDAILFLVGVPLLIFNFSATVAYAPYILLILLGILVIGAPTIAIIETG